MPRTLSPEGKLTKAGFKLQHPAASNYNSELRVMLWLEPSACIPMVPAIGLACYSCLSVAMQLTGILPHPQTLNCNLAAFFMQIQYKGGGTHTSHRRTHIHTSIHAYIHI